MANNNYIFLNNWFFYEFKFTFDTTSIWNSTRVTKTVITFLIKYALLVLVPNFKFTSVFGFAILINMITQMWSGFILAMYYIPDPSFTSVFREEYMNELWWFFYVYKTHVIGVDTIFILSYIHILKKIYIKNYIGGSLQGWVTGSYAFLVYHVVVFLGITLSSNHLGDLTLTIGASIFWSLFLNKHKIYTIFFTNKHLNTDQLTRFMIGHYVIAWYYIYLVQNHVMYIHEQWQADSSADTNAQAQSPQGSWLVDALKKEATMMLTVYVSVFVADLLLVNPDYKPIDFAFFEQWSESEVEDINFFIVGPHWYFRPHMGLLTVCAKHYEGLFWLIFYYLSLTLMPIWSKLINNNETRVVFKNISLLQKFFFTIFVSSLLYVGNTLPCARFYYADDEGFFGNSTLKAAYQYIYIYLTSLVHLIDKLENRVDLIIIEKLNFSSLALKALNFFIIKDLGFVKSSEDIITGLTDWKKKLKLIFKIK